MVRYLYRTNYWKFLKREIICLAIFKIIGIFKSLSCILQEGALVMATCTFEEMFMKDLAATKPQPPKRTLRTNLAKPINNTSTSARSDNKRKYHKLDLLYKKYGLVSPNRRIPPSRQSKRIVDIKKSKDESKKSPKDIKKATNQNVNPVNQTTRPNTRSSKTNSQITKNLTKTTKSDYTQKIGAADIASPHKKSNQIVKITRSSNVIITRQTERTEREKRLAYMDVLNPAHLGANTTIAEDEKTCSFANIQKKVNWLSATIIECTLCDWEGSKYLYDNHYLEFHSNHNITDEKYFDALL